MSNRSPSPSRTTAPVLGRHADVDALAPHRPGPRWRELVQPRFRDQPPRFQWELAMAILRESVPPTQYGRITSGDHATHAELQGWLRVIRGNGLRAGGRCPTEG